MEDKDLKELFARYNPDLGPDDAFMRSLKRKLDVVEHIKQEGVKIKRNGRIAVAMAAMAGFLAGILFSFAIPYITEVLGAFMDMMGNSDIRPLADTYAPAAWLIVGCASVFISMNTYDLSRALLGREHKGQS